MHQLPIKKNSNNTLDALALLLSLACWCCELPKVSFHRHVLNVWCVLGAGRWAGAKVMEGELDSFPALKATAWKHLKFASSLYSDHTEDPP